MTTTKLANAQSEVDAESVPSSLRIVCDDAGSIHLQAAETAEEGTECERLQRSLLEHRERFIAEHPEVPVYRVDFAKLTENPEDEILKLVEFLGVEPTQEELDSAIAHVNPELRKFG